MKILFLTNNLSKGGKERRLLELIKGLMQKPEMEIELVLFKDTIEYPEIHNLNISLHILERKPKFNPLVFLRLYSICKRLKPDVIHTWSSMATIFAFPCVKFQRIPLLNSSVANAPNNLKIWKKELFWAKLTFLYSDIIVGNSKAGLKAFGAPKSKSICIHNGFDFKRSKKIDSKDQIRKKYNLGSNLVIGKIAAFANRKDYDTYLKAANQVLQQRDNVSFFAVGNGPNFELIKSSVPNQIKDKIIFTGALRDVESLINIFDVGILSTNNEVHGEGISNSIMEYMALAKPVVATEGGGTSEIVQHDETGYLVPHKSPEIMANRILELIDNLENSKQMGIAGRKRIEEHFNLAKMTSAFFQFFTSS